LLVFCCFILSSAVVLAQEKKTVSGVVTDAKGAPLSGVTVQEQGSKKMTLSDANGKFSLQVNRNATLVLSYVGFEEMLVKTGSSDSYNVSLQEKKGNLNEVVVTSLGISRKQRALGYAATTVKAEELVKTAPTNFATALYGKAPGLQISAAPGGSMSGVAVQIRGLNSISFASNPLIIMDGIPIRDGGFNSGDYWGDGRTRANGLVDLNPEDIENISVLKGAAAAALYGSEGRNGVLVITTKSGKNKKGISVDFNTNYFQDKIAYQPRYQNVRGAGFPVPWGVYNSDAEGFGHYNLNGTEYRTMIQGSLNFGPVFDGKPILSWDGQVRPYSAQPDRYAALFQTAHNSTQNIALVGATDNFNTRLSVTRQHSEGLSLNSKNDRISTSLNSSLKLGKTNTVDVVINYINQKIHNRPLLVDRMINNFTGMMPAFDNGAWYLNKYQTSLGYKYVTGDNQSLTPDENLKIPNYRTDILDYMWNVNKNTIDETSNRIIGSITDTWQIINGLSLRGRVATDMTSFNEQDKNYSSTPLLFGASGMYGVKTNTYTVLYGDVLLTYNRKITQDLDLSLMGGYTATKESGYTTNVSTDGGLITENWFDIKASKNTYSSNTTQSFLIKDALLGTLNLNYKNYLYAEGTIRRDRTSTMYPTNNAFVYPSVNAGFILSDAFKLPDMFNYAKIRASWGIVGGYPPPYVANIAYSLTNYGIQSGSYPVLSTTTQGVYGNNKISPEKKHETEFGIEVKMLHNRLGVDMSYYSAKNVDQILTLTLPSSSGANSILANIGTLANKGFELSLNAVPVQTKDLRWSIIFNYFKNQNKILKLTTGSNELLHGDYDGNAYQIKSIVGQPVGDIYSHPTLKNDKGENIISSDGLYQADPNKMEKYGNVQPKGAGGILNSVTYKNFTLDFNIDFKYGGYVIPTGLFWLTSRGLTEESLNYMDAAHGGMSYYLNSDGKGVQTTASQGPNGEVVMHDGMLLDGVTADGQKNTNVVSQAYYYWVTYNWGGPQYSPTTLYNLYIKKNDYLKMREISLTYNLSPRIAGKILAKRLAVSVFARNAFYLYRTIKDMDAEQLTTGNTWLSNVNNAGSQPASRTFGVMLRASF